MKNDVWISVIIPMYNTKSYIEKCILSVLQGVENRSKIEVIVVDDGSTDGSYQLVEQLSRDYPCIRLLHQENSGQSVARNYGLRYAKGDYIFFLDSDDFIEKRSLDRLYQICVKNNLDFVRTNWNIVNEDGDLQEIVKIRQCRDILERVLTAKDMFKKTISSFYIVGPCNGMYKRSFLKQNSIDFPEGIQFEDNTFTLKTYFTDPDARVMLVDYPFYQVRVRSGSTTTMDVTAKKVYDQLENITLMNHFIHAVVPLGMKNQAQRAVSSLTFTMTSYYYRLPAEERILVRKDIPQKILISAIKHPQTEFQRLKLIAFAFFPKLLNIYESKLRLILHRS